MIEFPNIQLSDFTVQEYKLMYLCGAWMTAAKIYAEDDEEAIFDADEAFLEKKGLRNWPYGVVLFQGNRRVKTYVKVDPYAIPEYYINRKQS